VIYAYFVDRLAATVFYSRAASARGSFKVRAIPERATIRGLKPNAVNFSSSLLTPQFSRVRVVCAIPLGIF
jgi:hypothetical protein